MAVQCKHSVLEQYCYFYASVLVVNFFYVTFLTDCCIELLEIFIFSEFLLVVTHNPLYTCSTQWECEFRERHTIDGLRHDNAVCLLW